MLVLGAILGGCGGNGSDSGGEGSGGGSPSSGGDNQELTIALSAEPQTTNVLYDSNIADVFAKDVTETLVGRDADSELYPLLAESWELKGTTWTFVLKKGIKFHDGTDLTAEDVVGSYNRLIDPKFKSPFRDGYAGGMKSVEAIDDYTVAIHGETADPTIPSRTSMIVIQPAEWTKFGDDRLETAMMGTGPYKFDGWDRGRQITLSRFDGYEHGPKARYDKVTIVFRPEASVRLSALQAGEVDVAHDLPADLADQAPKVASGPLSEVFSYRVKAIPGAPLGDKRLRQAVTQAIDRELLWEKIYGGKGESAHGQAVIAEVLGFNPDLEEWPYDPEKAKELIREAGAEGTKLTMVTPQGRWTRDREVGQAVAEMLNQVGFKVDSKYKEFEQYFNDIVPPEGEPLERIKSVPDLVFTGNNNDLMDSVFTLEVMAATGGPVSGQMDPRLDALVQKGKQAVDLETRAKYFADAWKLNRDEAYYVTLSRSVQSHGISEDLEWTPRPQVSVFFNDIVPAGQ